MILSWYKESSLGGPEGLYYYNARWYDPTLSRFAQADTMGEGDRYAYVGNNPTNSIDPTGHVLCDADGYCGDQADVGKFKPIDAEDIYKNHNDEKQPKDNVIQPIVDNYIDARDALFLMCGFTCVDVNGKISDIVLMAIIIAAEFGAYRDMAGTGMAFNAALEGLSNQYHSTKTPSGNALCNGNCGTAENQISWLSDQEFSYSKLGSFLNTVKGGSWKDFLGEAMMAARGYNDGDGKPSWSWEDINKKDLGTFKYPLTTDPVRSLYNKDPNYIFIVHE